MDVEIVLRVDGSEHRVTVDTRTLNQILADSIILCTHHKERHWLGRGHAYYQLRPRTFAVAGAGAAIGRLYAWAHFAGPGPSPRGTRGSPGTHGCDGAGGGEHVSCQHTYWKETSHGDRPGRQENTAEIDIHYEDHG